MVNEMRKKNNHNKRLRAFIEANIRKHAIIFTVDKDASVYVNRINPGARTCVSRETLAAFTPGTNIYNMIRLNWVAYPVVVLKDAFGKITKTHILDTEMRVDNATWTQATQYAIQEGDEFIGQFQQRFRANVGFVFVLDGTPMTTDKIKRILDFDKTFFTIDDSRDLRTNKEKYEDEQRLIEALEKVAG